MKIKLYKEQISSINDLFNQFCSKLNKKLDNYENIQNVLNLNCKNMNKDINDFLNGNFKNKMNSLINKFNYKKLTTLIYNINKNENKIKLFDNEFVKNNKDNYYLIIEDKSINICEYYYSDNETINKNKKLKVRLIEKNLITNMSYMFSDCKSLSSISGVPNWNTNNVTSMSYKQRKYYF